MAAILQKVVDDECDKNMKFKIIKKGGAKIKRKLQISNPLETAGCSDTHARRQQEQVESAEQVMSTTQLGANSAQRMESQSILEKQVVTYIQEGTNT